MNGNSGEWIIIIARLDSDPYSRGDQVRKSYNLAFFSGVFIKKTNGSTRPVIASSPPLIFQYELIALHLHALELGVQSEAFPKMCFRNLVV